MTTRDPIKHKAARDAWRAKHHLLPVYLTQADRDALARARHHGETMNACIKRLLHEAAARR